GPPQRLGLIPDEWVDPAPIVESIQRTVDRYRKTGRLPLAIEDFLYRRPPRLRGRVGREPVIPPEMELLQGSINAAIDLDNSTLCIQGPPGSGKTYTAAHMIDRKSTRLNSSHGSISYAVFCLKKKKHDSLTHGYKDSEMK